MANLVLPDDIEAGTDMVAGELQGNFEAIESFVNDEVMHRDAAQAFTSIPSMPAGDPSTNTQAVSFGALKARYGVVAKRIHAMNSLDMTHAGIETSGITLPSFTMPTISNGKCLQIECMIPQIELGNNGGAPIPGAHIQARLRTAADSTVAFGGVLVGALGMVGPTAVPSIYFMNQFHDNTLITAGATVQLTLKGTITGGQGKVTFVGSTGAPIIICARLV